MGAWIDPSSWHRFRRHLPEIVAVLVVVVAFDAAGLVVHQRVWMLPALVLLGTALISAAYSRWDRNATVGEIHLRALTQTGTLTVVSYMTGWGFALAMVQLFAVADNVKYSGAGSARTVIGWAIATTATGQLAIQTGVAPAAIPPAASHLVAAFAVLVLAFVGGRIQAMTEAKEQAERDLTASEARFRSLVQEASDVFMIIGGAKVTFVSPSIQRVLGHAEDTILGRPYLDLVHPDDRQGVIEAVTGMLDTPGASGLIECRLQHASGRWIAFESNCHNLLHDPHIAGFVTTGRDISERKELEAELEHRAFHDALTGLANRALFRDRVERTVARSTREPGLVYGVLYIDLDGFKVVNDTRGHGIGDGLLVHIAGLLGGCIRDNDTAARLGGDEFAILLAGLQDPAGAARVAQRILDGLKAGATIDGHEVQIDASIGIAFGEPGQDAEELLRNADIAMYMAKSTGKGCYETFEPSMHLQLVERLEIEADLQHGIECDEFVLHYQPIVGLQDGRIRGIEALIRWEHPERGRVSPDDFIPIAEESGLIVPIGRWVLAEACNQIAAWQRMFEPEPALTLSVNVSMRQFSHGSIVADVAEALAASGLRPEHLTLELTESALVDDTEATIALLRDLKALGVRLAIDDFGTGYSSLSYLQRFPVDILKIDRSFVEGMVTGSHNPALVRAVVELGHSLHLETVAEGIEHDEELTQFRALKCSLGQGYLFARPSGRDDIQQLLSDRAAAGMLVADGASRSQTTPSPACR
jgi:diguanylate cyclase (GGDEF)-like protein/PAS domain S-box-containing protein